MDNVDGFSGEAHKSFDVVLFCVVGKFKDDNVPAFRFTEDIRELAHADAITAKRRAAGFTKRDGVFKAAVSQ